MIDSDVLFRRRMTAENETKFNQILIDLGKTTETDFQIKTFKATLTQQTYWLNAVESSIQVSFVLILYRYVGYTYHGMLRVMIVMQC